MRAVLGVPARKRWEFFSLSHSLTTSCILFFFWLLHWMHARIHLIYSSETFDQWNGRWLMTPFASHRFFDHMLFSVASSRCLVLSLQKQTHHNRISTCWELGIPSPWLKSEYKGTGNLVIRLWRHIPFPCPVLSRSFSLFRYIFLLVSLLGMWAYTCTSSRKHFSLRSLFSSLFSRFLSPADWSKKPFSFFSLHNFSIVS